MGVINFMTGDTNEPILTEDGSYPRTVYMPMPDGSPSLEEPHYAGYGIIDDCSIFSLVAQWNLSDEVNEDLDLHAAAKLGIGILLGYVYEDKDGVFHHVFEDYRLVVDGPFYDVDFETILEPYGKTANRLIADGTWVSRRVSDAVDIKYPLKLSFNPDAKYDDIGASVPAFDAQDDRTEEHWSNVMDDNHEQPLSPMDFTGDSIESNDALLDPRLGEPEVKRYYQWRVAETAEDGEELWLVPRSDPFEWERAIDLLYNTPEQAMEVFEQGDDISEEEARDWILVRMTEEKVTLTKEPTERTTLMSDYTQFLGKVAGDQVALYALYGSEADEKTTVLIDAVARFAERNPQREEAGHLFLFGVDKEDVVTFNGESAPASEVAAYVETLNYTLWLIKDYDQEHVKETLDDAESVHAVLFNNLTEEPDSTGSWDRLIDDLMMQFDVLVLAAVGQTDTDQGVQAAELLSAEYAYHTDTRDLTNKKG